jgi:hypothetical protein
MVLIVVCSLVNAKLYTESEIDDFHRLENKSNQENIITEFENSKSVDAFLNSQLQKKNESLQLESNLFN